jgi:hypothetical protein
MPHPMTFVGIRENTGSIFLCELVSLSAGVTRLERMRGKRKKNRKKVKRREKASGKVLYKIKEDDGRTTYIATAFSS